jgi:hypothetical protein
VELVGGGSGVVGCGVVGRDEEELGEPAWLSRPVGGGLLGESVASGAAFGWSSDAPWTVVELPSRAPAAQIIAMTTAAEPAVAMALRRRYTDGGRGPRDSSTSGK